MNKALQYGYNLLCAVDQAANTILGGSPTETISARLGRNYRDTWMEKTVNFLFRWQSPDHCGEAVEHTPPEFEEGAVIALKEEKDKEEA